MAPEVDSDDENVEYEDDTGHRYRLYLDELEDANTAPPRDSSASLQGELDIRFIMAASSGWSGTCPVPVLPESGLQRNHVPANTQ